MKKQFISSTIGMMVVHESLKKPKLVRIEFYSTNEGVELHAVSGHNLNRITSVPTVKISSDEFDERNYDYYNDQVEFDWAIKKCGLEY